MTIKVNEETASSFSQNAIPKDSSEKAYIAARYCVCGHLDYSHYRATGMCNPHSAECHCQTFQLRPITQDGATASAPTTTVTDHGQASQPKSVSSTQSVVDEIRERRSAIDNLPEPVHRRCTSSCPDSSYDSDRHTHTEECRFGERARIKANFRADAPTDIDTLIDIATKQDAEIKSLRSIIDSLKAEKDAAYLRGRKEACDENAPAWEQRVSDMKAELIKAFDAEIARQAEFGMYPSAEDFRIALRAVEVNDLEVK